MAASRNNLSADLERRVGIFLVSRLVSGAKLCVGLSGGCDSVVLLSILRQLDFSSSLSAIHVHHGLSPNAGNWAEFCGSLCHSLGVPLSIRHVTVDTENGFGLEAAARQARYAAFAESDADCLLLAQHRGDQAETLLLNLLRGAGVTGAAAMPAERQFGTLRLLRPLLDVSRADLEAYATSHGLSWIDDESNQDTLLARNYLRHETLAALSQRFPEAEAALARAAANFSEAAGLLDELAEQDWALAKDVEMARLDVLRRLSLPRLKNLLRYRLRQLGWQVPVATRLDEFARQLQTAAPDRHPELVLTHGRMRSARQRLHWLPPK